MGVKVTHSIGDLASDLRTMSRQAPPKLSRVVREQVKEGTRAARAHAKASAGPHGKTYWKRISGEMTGPLTGEFGPTGNVVGRAVGAGYRKGVDNTDLDLAAKEISWAFGHAVMNAADGLFWPKS